MRSTLFHQSKFSGFLLPTVCFLAYIMSAPLLRHKWGFLTSGINRAIRLDGIYVLVYSVDGLEGKEAAAMRKQLASRLSAKWGRKYSQVCGFLRSRLAIALVRATTSQCLRGTRDPTRRTTADDIVWVSYQGLRLYH